MASNLKKTTRTAVDQTGRLGDFYDVIEDKIIHEKSRNLSIHRQPIEAVFCKVIPSQAGYSPVYSFEEATQDRAIAESLLVGLLETRGISDVMNFTGDIDDKVGFLYICYQDYKEAFEIKLESLPKLTNENNVTHLITEICYGFDILCVLSIPNKSYESQLTNYFNEAFNNIDGDSMEFQLGDQDKELLASFRITGIYGLKEYSDESCPSLQELIEKVQTLRKIRLSHHPLRYTLDPLQQNTVDTGKQSQMGFRTHDGSFLPQTIKTELAEVIRQMKKFNKLLKAQSRRMSLVQLRKQIQQNLIDARKRAYSNQENPISITQTSSTLEDNSFHAWKKEYRKWTTNIQFIKELHEYHIEYLDINDFQLPANQKAEIDQINKKVRERFQGQYDSVHIWYSSKSLRKKQGAKWAEMYESFKSKLGSSSIKTHLVYVDTTRSIYEKEEISLQHMNTGEKPNSSMNGENQTITQDGTSINEGETNNQTIFETKVREINALLLGETGVGKSTFINALVNYLAHNSFEQAEQQKIISIIPVSFITTVGDDLEEVQVNIGEQDPNENFSNTGASVTQHCRSYLIPLRPDLHLRLIDTPGMGDTRGIEQDMKNIDHILSYLDQFSHLDAICFLLRPNVSRLNIFFRFCLQQLFTYLTPQAYENIIFCFTNTRSTFYQVGETGALLVDILKKSEFSEVRFEKSNTFCFDSESFRYLMSTKQSISLAKVKRKDIAQSWKRSTDESNRLIQYFQARKPYNIDQWQTARKLVLEITGLVYPLMIELRLMMYNVILTDNRIGNRQITIHTKQANQSICSECAVRHIRSVDVVDVMEYQSEKYQGKESCHCRNGEKQIVLESLVSYYCIPIHSKEILEQNNFLLERYSSNLNQLRLFLQKNGENSEQTQFCIVLEAFLRDEEDISCQKGNDRKPINTIVHKKLKKLEKNWKIHKSKTQTETPTPSINQIQTLITKLKSNPRIEQHYASIRKTRRLKMEMDERFIPLNRIGSKQPEQCQF